MYASTSFQRMRTRVIIPRQRSAPGQPVGPRQLGCVHPRRPGRSNERRQAIAASLGGAR